ncbi:actin-binding Rho-activating protein [Protopterus annectens]|uniref:actin-binding Rho-activating protein n=1 Tax=Protopterus annectens TaxID=7888 RepID=UPI001CFAC0AC|nr:actin-binding Rho-activating protein [Protopterus annectens]
MPTTDENKAKKSTSKGIKKIRTASFVNSLTKSWQQWSSDHLTKQASEPTGWIPDSEEKDKPAAKCAKISKRTIKETSQDKQISKTTEKDTSQDKLLNVVSVDTLSILSPQAESEGVTKDLDMKPLEVKIKSIETRKTAASKPHKKEKQDILLSEKYKETLSRADKMLYGKKSPTRRRKCSSLVSELTKSWKQVEKENEAPNSTGQDFGLISMERDDGLLRKEENENQVESGNFRRTEGAETVRIKRPSSSMKPRPVDEINSINMAYKKYSPVENLKSKWQGWADEHVIKQKVNPFSDEFDHDYAMSIRLQKGDEGYGRPKEGSKTAERAQRAEAHIHREMRDLCFIISTMTDPGPDGLIQVTFQELFDRYVRISDKVVGILMRARKHGLVYFEGEMLWQGRDDDVIITLLV